MEAKGLRRVNLYEQDARKQEEHSQEEEMGLDPCEAHSLISR